MGEQPAAFGWRPQVPGVVLAAIAVGIAVRVVLLSLPPLFFTDVSYYNAQAVGDLLRGVDPYGAAYAVPPQLATPGAESVFAYLPGVFAFLVPGDFGTGARLGLVACDIVVAAALVLYRPKVGGLMAALFLLLPPVVLLSTAFLNDSLPSVAFVSAAVLLEARGRRVPAAALFGLALASSQEAWLIFPVYAAYSLRSRRPLGPLVSLGVGAAVVAPFALWDLPAFVSDTVLFQLQRAAAPFLSPGPFGVNVNPSLQGVLSALGASAPLAVRGAAAVAVIGVVAWRSKPTVGYLLWGSAAAVALCLFLLAGDFFWSYLELPFVLALFWAVPRFESVLAPSTLKDAEPLVGAEPR
ncbi:MAG: hypothetical protein JRM99_02150 [Nitrososphaerota archaeon]|nr:hypothetical protein [Nitrososphaerota archaeon]